MFSEFNECSSNLYSLLYSGCELPNTKSLLGLTCQTVADMIKGKNLRRYLEDTQHKRVIHSYGRRGGA